MNRPHHGSSGLGIITRRDGTAGRPAPPLLLLALALALVTGCGADSKRSGSAASPAVARSAAPATVEQLAAHLRCTPQLRGQPIGYRQAVCKAPTGDYMINTFDTDQGQRDWLEYSAMYGGSYLVGTRWIIVSEPHLLDPLRGRLGGRIEHGQGTGSGGGGAGGAGAGAGSGAQ